MEILLIIWIACSVVMFIIGAEYAFEDVSGFVGSVILSPFVLVIIAMLILTELFKLLKWTRKTKK